MRRLGVACITLVLTLLLQTAACFATTLEITSTYPKDGATGVYPLNFAVKVYFDQDVSSEENKDINNISFLIKDPAGKRLSARVFYDSKNKDMVLVAMNETLEASTEYTFTVLREFTAASGETLEDDYTIRFTTRDMQKDINTSMMLMVVMFIGIMFFSMKQMKRQAQKEAEAKDKKSKVNPYKVSKETGKSVAEIVEKTEKEKKKKAAAEAKKKGQPVEDDEDDYEDEDEWEEENDNKRVTGPRPISAAGSTYKSGKKAKAEAAAKKKAAAGTTKPKNQSGKAKNKKKK
jgi:hypothetical protein